MMRLSSTSLRLSLLLAAAPFATVAAQAGTPASDSAPLARVDSVQNGRSWLVALLHKIARRSDEVAPADTSAYSDGEVSAEEVARYARPEFHSRKDSLEFEAARAKADRSKGYRIVVDLFAHSLYVIDGDDTLRAAPAATAMNASLTFGKKTWRFETPRGVRTVLEKEKEPSWTPPEWHYAEVASQYGLKLRHLNRGERVRVRNGTILTTRGDEVGVIQPGETEFVPLVLDEHIVFDNTLFIPPAGTKHRTMKGELGHYRLKLGDGYQLHGTPNKASIGTSATHGCVRMHDEDIEWLYNNVPIGTKVYLY